MSPALTTAPARLASGTAFALAAGLMWGLVFVSPLLLPEYPPVLQSFGRYLAFGLIALPLAWFSRKRLALLTRADWLEALKLAAVGNLVYYLFLASAIQRAGAPLPTMIIGSLPVVIAIVANLRAGSGRDGRIAWRAMAPSLLAILCGILLVNQAETSTSMASAATGLAAGRDRAIGALLAVGALACWTWYPLRNADWLRAHPGRSPTTWATAQGIATLPLALAGGVGYTLYALGSGDAAAMLTPVGATGWWVPLGPRPLAFVGLMLAIGLFASWLGTLCWNEASQRLPTALVGQLIVFETLSALAYAFVLRGHAPRWPALVGVGLLVAGVAWAVRVKPVEVAAAAHPT